MPSGWSSVAQWQMGRGGNKALEELCPRNHAEIRWLPAIHRAKAHSAQGFLGSLSNTAKGTCPAQASIP
jgi:hypothetical protein